MQHTLGNISFFFSIIMFRIASLTFDIFFTRLALIMGIISAALGAYSYFLNIRDKKPGFLRFKKRHSSKK